MLQEAADFLKTRKKMNLLMVLINVVVFVVLSFMGDTENAKFVYDHGGCFTPAVIGGEYWRLLTAVFLHFGLPHLAYNMVCLLTVGDRVEEIFGWFRYLLVFLLGGIMGNVLTVLVENRTGDFAVSAGASGATFALVGTMVVYLLANRGRFGKEMVSRILIVALLMLAEGFTSEGTNNLAHVAGALTGVVLGAVFLALKKLRRK